MLSRIYFTSYLTISYSQFLEISENRELTVNIFKPQLKLKVLAPLAHGHHLLRLEMYHGSERHLHHTPHHQQVPAITKAHLLTQVPHWSAVAPIRWL